MTITENIFWLAVNIYHEARGEPLEGQIAIGHVCWNRAIKAGASLKDVILKPFQFSWHNGNAYPPIKNYDALQSCLNVSLKIVNERMEGKDLWRSDHYYNPAKANPSWADKMTFIKRIGNHDFYRS